MALSGSGVKKDAFASYGAGTNAAAAAGATANPIYQQWATSPFGYTQQQKSNMTTASDQTLGGGVAAAVGQGDLDAARTGNEGGFAAATDDAARQAMVQQSQNNLGVQNQDANLAFQRQKIGLQGEQQMYDVNSENALRALGIANEAKPTFWQTFAQQAAGRLLRQ